jgi:hypothetical protein
LAAGYTKKPHFAPQKWGGTQTRPQSIQASGYWPDDPPSVI